MNNLPDKEAFLALIQNNKGIIYKVCHSFCTDKNDREDLAQEIIYQLWKSYNNYKPQYKFSTWMYRVALNVAISFYRKVKAGGHTIHIEEHVFEIEDYSSSAEMEENIKLLEQFIKAFKELDRALILLYLEGKPYKEIAEILGISETNVATRINRIKDKLKQKFATVK